MKLGRLLLSNAVNRSQSPNQFRAIDPDHAPFREFFLKDIESDGIIGTPESGDEDNLIGDIEIGIAGRQSLTLLLDETRHGQFHNPQEPAILVSSHAKP